MKEGTLVSWLAEEGAELAAGDDVAEVETEKINGVVEAPAPGVLRRRVAAIGDVVPVGGLLGVLADASVPDTQVDVFVAEFHASFVREDEVEQGPQPETLTVGTRSMRYVRYGEGDEALVLLHGFGGDLGSWLFNAEALALGRRVYALDLPGHGGSTKDVGRGDLDSYIAVVADALGALALPRAHLVGHSLGGVIAAAFALAYPERTSSLVLIAPAGFGEEINSAYLEGFIVARTRRDLKPNLEMLFADASVVTRQLVDDVLRYKRIDGVSEALRAVADAFFPGGRQANILAERLASLDIPMLVVWGSEDRVIPVAQVDAAPPSAQVQLVHGTGHSPHMEAAGEVNRLVEGFLTTLRKPTAA
jgi:pyruvate dehydrogenase E2 component (dihydrolipoamide acetyltransferase)